MKETRITQVLSCLTDKELIPFLKLLQMLKLLRLLRLRGNLYFSVFSLFILSCDQPVGGPPPEPPVYLNKLIPGPASITASWPAAAGAESYEVWLGETGDFSDAALAQTVDSPFVFIDGLDHQKTYWVYVRSRNRVGASAFAAPLSETPHRVEAYNEGFYWSVANSMGGETIVGTTFSVYEIVGVEIIDYYDDAERPEVARALEELPVAIVAAGSPEVDGITGATYTSNRIKEAVRDNMEKARK
jgi:uncharacterized protein with FMN-binding domain